MVTISVLVATSKYAFYSLGLVKLINYQPKKHPYPYIWGVWSVFLVNLSDYQGLIKTVFYRQRLLSCASDIPVILLKVAINPLSSGFGSKSKPSPLAIMAIFSANTFKSPSG